jgi:hypothetical protein
VKQKSLDWESVIIRSGCETSPIEIDLPFGFATRIVASWRIAQREVALRRWSRWALRGALGSMAFCACLMALGLQTQHQPILLPPPESEFVTPLFLTP